MNERWDKTIKKQAKELKSGGPVYVGVVDEGRQRTYDMTHIIRICIALDIDIDCIDHIMTAPYRDPP